MKIILRIISLPAIILLYLIASTYAITISIYRWVRYGGELVVYKEHDKVLLQEIFIELKKQYGERMIHQEFFNELSKLKKHENENINPPKQQAGGSL